MTHPTGIWGSSRVRESVEVWMLFAMAKVLWKMVLTNSRLNTLGSEVVAVQVIVTTPPVVAPVGVLRVIADARGRARVARALNKKWLKIR